MLVAKSATETDESLVVASLGLVELLLECVHLTLGCERDQRVDVIVTEEVPAYLQRLSLRYRRLFDHAQFAKRCGQRLQEGCAPQRSDPRLIPKFVKIPTLRLFAVRRNDEILAGEQDSSTT